jgi:hypothetical protein
LSQVLTREQRYGLLVVFLMQELSQDCRSQANRGRDFLRPRVRVGEGRIDVYCGCRVGRRSRCRRVLVAIGVVAQMLMDLGVACFRPVGQRQFAVLILGRVRNDCEDRWQEVWLDVVECCCLVDNSLKVGRVVRLGIALGVLDVIAVP